LPLAIFAPNCGRSPHYWFWQSQNLPQKKHLQRLNFGAATFCRRRNLRLTADEVRIIGFGKAKTFLRKNICKDLTLVRRCFGEAETLE
jgi:hypothetical protein